jgi:hypothetical protein
MSDDTDAGNDDVRPDEERSAAAPGTEQDGAPAAGDAGRAGGTSNEEPGAVGEQDDEDSAGQVREERRSKQVGDRTIDQARRSAVAQGDGPATYVESQIVTYSGRRVYVQKQILEDREDIDREFATYVPVAGFDDMGERLETNGVLVLHGVPGSGRTATARMLFGKARCRRVGTLSVNNDEDLFYILHDQLENPPDDTQPLMTAGDGYVIEWTGDLASSSPLKGFAGAVKAAGARVVIVVDNDLESTAAEFQHDHPWPESRTEVMAKHLDRHLRDHRDCCSSELLDGYRKQIVDHHVVQSRLNLAPSVLRIVEMARFLAKRLHEIPVTGIGRLVGEWDDSAWRLARQVLAGDAPPDKPHLIPQQQAFRIAYAVFHEQPLAYAFEAGDLLLAKVISFEVRKRPLKSRVFDRSVEALIHPMMAAKITATEDDQPRRAQLVDESLILSILEVAWHEYAQLRGPLRDWLDDLAGRPNADVRVRAAQIVGLLATFDYAGVFELLIKRWAKSKAVYRGAAALAMDQIARHPPLSSKVRRQVEEWTRSRLITEQDTAARWHGLRTERAAVTTAIKQLNNLGSRPELRRGMSIAWSMSLLFLNGYVDEVVDELGRWIDVPNPYLPHHAVRTLLILTDPKGPGKQGRTRLSELVAADAHRETVLVRMWHRALTSRTVGAPAWNALHEWLIEADRDEHQSALMESVAAQMFTGALARRALFHLTLWHKRRPGVQLIGRVRTRLIESKGS